MEKEDTKVMTVRMDAKLHQMITDMAKKNTCTFNLELQALVKKGIETYDAEQEVLRRHPVNGFLSKQKTKKNA